MVDHTSLNIVKSLTDVATLDVECYLASKDQILFEQKMPFDFFLSIILDFMLFTAGIFIKAKKSLRKC